MSNTSEVQKLVELYAKAKDDDERLRIKHAIERLQNKLK